MSANQSERDKEMLDARVMTDMHKERIARDAALAERFREAEKRRNGGGAR